MQINDEANHFGTAEVDSQGCLLLSASFSFVLCSSNGHLAVEKDPQVQSLPYFQDTGAKKAWIFKPCVKSKWSKQHPGLTAAALLGGD